MAERTSCHYLPPSYKAKSDEVPIQNICQVLEKAKLPFRTCKTGTADGIYRETKKMVQYRKSEGYSVVEKEYTSWAACAKMRGIPFGQVLLSTDSLEDANAHDI